MTIVMIWEREGRHVIKVSGHAERLDDSGRNDACVAVSMLSQTLVQTLRNHSVGFKSYNDKLDNDAYVYAEAECGGPEDAFVSAVFEMAKTGFSMLAETYPERVYLHVQVMGGEEKSVDVVC